MKVKDFKAYLNFYNDEKEVKFILPSGQPWEIDGNMQSAHNLKDQEKREDCKIFLK